MEKKTNHLLESALKYLSKGWSIIPVNPTTKRSILNSWKIYQKQAPTREEIIEWWTKWPWANVAFLPGKQSGLDVVDVDPRHGGIVDGLTPTIISKTGGGGWHYFYKHTPGLHCKNGLRPGIDFKTEGGYVILPPSIHKSGNTYEWSVSPDKADFAELPIWVIEEVNKRIQSETVNISSLTGVEEGSRDDSMLKLTDSLLTKFSPEDTWFVINQINRTYKPPLDHGSMQKIFKQALNFILEGGNQEATIRIPTATEFLKQDFGNAEWLVQDLIPIGGSALIIAKRESFKTWLALYIAYRVAKGSPLWDRLQTLQTKVLYIANDDPTHNFKDRVSKFEVDDNFFIYHNNLPTFSIEQVNASFNSVKALIKKDNVGLIIVDIVRNTHNKDSNPDKDVKAVFDKYKELRQSNPQLVFIFLLHPSKEQVFEKRFNKREIEEAVGSYYWEAAVDTVLSLKKITDETDTDKVVINVTKNKQSAKKIKPFIGIQRKPDGPVEYIFEEHIPDKLKKEAAKEYILVLLAQKDYKRQELIDLTVAAEICSSRLIEDALTELNNEKRVIHTTTKPHIYSLPNNEPREDSANRKTNSELRNAESVTQPELINMEEVENDRS